MRVDAAPATSICVEMRTPLTCCWLQERINRINTIDTYDMILAGSCCGSGSMLLSIKVRKVPSKVYCGLCIIHLLTEKNKKKILV